MADKETVETLNEHTIYKDSATGHLFVRGPHLPFRDLQQPNVEAARSLITWLCDSDVIEIEGLEPPPFKPTHPLLIRKWDNETYRSSDMRIFQETEDGFEAVNEGPIANVPYRVRTSAG